MKKYIILILIAIVVIIVIIIGAFIFWQNFPKKYTGPVEKINLGVANNFMCSLMFVAENKGYFKENGLEVNIKKISSGKVALDTMLKDASLDIVTVAQTPVVFSSFINSNFSIIAGTSYSYNDVFVLARRDRGITSPADLRGRNIGVTEGTIGHYFLNIFLNNNNLLLSDVKVINLPADQLTQSMTAGTVDAISTWQPYISNAQKALGNNSIIFPNNNIYREDIYSVSNKEFIKNHPEAIVRFLKAIQQTENFILQNKDQAAAIMANELNMDKDFVFSIFGNYQFGLFLDQATIQTIENQARWAIQNKLTDKTTVPNYLDYIYINALEEVKPGAMTIVH